MGESTGPRTAGGGCLTLVAPFSITRSDRARMILAPAAFWFAIAPVALSIGGADDAPRRFEDPAHDAVARPTDPGAAGTFDSDGHRLPDLLELRLGGWTPSQPELDLLEGEYAADSSDADFVRVDLVVDGLMNPPGEVGPGLFQPFRYGPNPLYGFVEIDMDENVNTGGELLAPQYRYLGNVVRFGGRINDGPLEGREALSADAFDQDIATAPLVERSGEEFHLALLGGEFTSSRITKVVGDSDSQFEAGETWQITAPFFHRAHGFEEFSFVEGGLLPGEYMPDVTVQFRHDPASDRTTISLVFPLTQVGAGLAAGVPPQPIDFDPTNQVSVEEALADLQFSAEFLAKFPTGDPNEALIQGWAVEDPEEFLDPGHWRITALLGSSYLFPLQDGVFYVWSDIYPNVERGDVDGDRQIDDDDLEKIEEYIESHDLDDGLRDEIALIGGFAENFSVFDVNHDGRVDGLDLLVEEADGDVDEDEDVDLRDFARFQNCQGAATLGESECISADLDLSGETNRDDLPWFIANLEGP